MFKEREHIRFDTVSEVSGYFGCIKELTGGFPSNEEFMVKNISLGGFNLISNYQPVIDNDYQIFINYQKKKFAFAVKVVFANVFRFQTDSESILKPGIVFSIGCQIQFENEAQKNLLMDIIRNKCGYPGLERSKESTN
jgi:hypothetical protein